MRMWMVDPTLMCKKHLLGEHGELHKFMHNWEKHHKIDGRLTGNAMEPLSYKVRHDALADEMLYRGYNHKSPLEQPDFSYLSVEQQEAIVDTRLSYQMLMDRCNDCQNLRRL